MNLRKGLNWHLWVIKWYAALTGSPRVRVGCMAHCLRKFKDFVKTFPKEQRQSSSANQIIKLIRALFDIEDKGKGLPPEERLDIRKSLNAETTFKELQEFVALEKGVVSTQSPNYAALRYAHEELPHIQNYLSRGFIEIDNNFAENAIRPFALGRRNWLFICSERGGQASANIYGLLISANANGIEPNSYLKKVIEQLPNCESTDDYAALIHS